MSTPPALGAARLRSRTDIIDGIRIHARESCTAPVHPAPVLVLVHGLAMSSRYMVPLARRLAPHYRVLAIDLPGFGRSGGVQPAPDIAGLAATLGAWIETLELRQVVLVGNSLGCQVVVEYAARAPQRVQALVLSGPTMDADARAPLPQAWRLARDIVHEEASLVPIFLADFLRAGVRRTWTTLRHGLAHRIEERLPLLPMPTLVVRGQNDPIAPAGWTRHLAGLLPRGRFAEIHGGAHANNYSDAAAFAALVLAHVADS